MHMYIYIYTCTHILNVCKHSRKTQIPPFSDLSFGHWPRFSTVHCTDLYSWKQETGYLCIDLCMGYYSILFLLLFLLLLSLSL